MKLRPGLRCGKVGSASRNSLGKSCRLERFACARNKPRRLWCTSTGKVHARAMFRGIGARVPGIDREVVVHIYTMRMKLHITNIGAPVCAILKVLQQYRNPVTPLSFEVVEICLQGQEYLPSRTTRA
jgi:hypothetical protein